MELTLIKKIRDTMENLEIAQQQEAQADPEYVEYAILRVTHLQEELGALLRIYKAQRNREVKLT